MDSASRRIGQLAGHLLAPADPPARQLEAQTTSASAGGSVWQKVPQAPPDAIIGITEAFKRDQHPKRLNLGVGAYRTEEGNPLVLDVVHQAELKLVTNPSTVKEYLGIAGDPEFCKLSAKLAFGEQSRALREGRIVTVQSLSGTGSLRVGAEFLAKHFPGPRTVLTPTPTWANHDKLFPQGGLKVQKYRYYKPSTRGLDYEGMVEDLQRAPEGALVLLHACAHNPTGVDPTPEQWQGILKAVQARRLVPFFDSAYQGFVSGDLNKDAAALRMFTDAGLELLVAQSYAKNMGLYGERVGALSVVLADPSVAKAVESQLKATIRPMYSSPPAHGAKLCAIILKDPALFKQWKVELKGMADRIETMRDLLYRALKEAGAPGSWEHIKQQRGMFSFTGLTKAQVEHLQERWHIYCTRDGRISMAGVSASKCRYLAEAITDAMKQGS